MQTVLQNLIFSLNVIIPIFLMMVLGWFVRKWNLLDDHSVGKLNQFTFRVLLPALLFMDLSTADFQSVWDTKFVLFCFIATCLSIGIAVCFSLFHKEKTERGEIIQASYRSSAAILGIAFINNIYGEATMAALMIVGTVPLYNVFAVIALEVTAPRTEHNTNRKKLALQTLLEVVTNPIILGIVAGILWSVLKIPQPVILSKSVSYLGNMATPLSLISLGASFHWRAAKENFPVVVGISVLKLIAFCGVFLPAAIWLGFRNEELTAILVMLGSATTGSCFVMAKNTHHEGTITAFAIMVTTLLSALTLTAWLFLLRTLGYV